MTTHYDVLGVSRRATHDEIKRAYHRLARRHHPDTHGQASATALDSARRRMVEINAAWAVLGEATCRRDYDIGLGLHRRPARPTVDAAGENGTGPRPEYPDWFEPEDQVPAADLEEDLDGAVRRGAAEFVVFVPVGVAAAAVISFALAIVVQWPALFMVSVTLVPVALVSFLAVPLVVIATRVRSR